MTQKRSGSFEERLAEELQRLSEQKSPLKSASGFSHTLAAI